MCDTSSCVRRSLSVGVLPILSSVRPAERATGIYSVPSYIYTP